MISLDRAKRLGQRYGWLVAALAVLGLATIAALAWFSDRITLLGPSTDEADTGDTDPNDDADDVDHDEDELDVELNDETGVPVDP